MKIGIISDSHDQIDKIKKAVAIFKKEKVALVYHLGDMCSPFTLHLYNSLPCSMKAVLGNNDADVYRLTTMKPGNVEFFGDFYADEFCGKRIAVLHGEHEEIISALFESGKYDLILRGHTHISEIKHFDKTILINPGSLMKKFDEKTKNFTPPSVAIYDLEKKVARIIKV